MAVTAAMIKELREISGAGMVDCKNALNESDGDMGKAVEILREKGMAAAVKKAGRIASEGLVYAYVADDNSAAVLVEVNSETDFVAKNSDFKSYVDLVAKQALSSGAASMDEFFGETWNGDASLTVKEALSQKIAVIGENLNIRRFEKYTAGDNSVFVTYIHGGGRVAVLLELVCASAGEAVVEAGKNVCMQIAAMSPRFVGRHEISEEFIEHERTILMQQALNEGKPEAIAKKMVEGRLNKQLKEFCLLEQEYVKGEDDKTTVGKYLENAAKAADTEITVKRFMRYETGEGLEKKEENFAEEVDKMIK